MTLITRAYGGIANYFYYSDNAGNPIDPRQYITGGNHFKKMSQELRVATPADKPFRVIAGAFYQHQANDILQEYHVDNLADDLSVNGRPGLIWLTKQKRVDHDYALFGEASFDVTPQITLTGGGRYYKFRQHRVRLCRLRPQSGVRPGTHGTIRRRTRPGAPRPVSPSASRRAAIRFAIRS